MVLKTSNYLQGPQSRRRIEIVLNIAVLSLALVFFAWVGSSAINSRKYPSLTGSNGAAIHRVARQQDAYTIYKSAGLRGARVIHLNRFFNMQNYSPKDRFVTTEFPLRIEDTDSVYEPGIDSHTWLFIATRTGPVRTVTTALPDQVFAELLKKSPNDRIFRYAAGIIKGYTYDIPRTITTLDALPAIDEPVVVNVDAGFFSGGADPSRTAVVLKKQCKDVRMLVLIESLDEPEVTDSMREQLRLFETEWRAQR